MTYEKGFKEEAARLSEEIGVKNTAEQLGISELMLSTIPNALVRGRVLPSMEIEISLITHSFDDLSAAAKEMANMILERSL